MDRLTDREIREKLATRGVETLSDTELLSIILKDGRSGDSLTMAENLLDSVGGSLSNLSKTDLPKLRMSAGIGMSRAAVLSAVFEFSRRLKACESALPSSIRTKDDVVKHMEPLLGRLRHEEMWAIYLTSANTVIEKHKVSQGGVTSMIVDVKLVVKRAVELLASGFILVHNHPSGIAAPSEEDIELTERISGAAILFDILVVDHIIIAEGMSYGFRSKGLIK